MLHIGSKTFICFFLSLSVAAGAQDKDEEERPTELSFVQARQLAKGGITRIRWLADGSSFYFTESAHTGVNVWRVDPKANEVEPLIDPPRLRAAVAELLGPDTPAADELFDDFELLEEEQSAVFTANGRAIEVDLGTYQAKLISTGDAPVDPALPRLVSRGFPATWADEWEVRSPDRSFFASVSDRNLQLRTVEGEVTRLTSDGDRERPWTMRGLSWSPDSRRLFAVKADRRGMRRLHLTDWTDPLREPAYRPWPSVSGKQPAFSGAIFEPGGGNRLDVAWGEDPYYRVLGWRKDASEVFVATVSRDVKRIRVVAFDARTGDGRVVLTEESPTFFDFPPNVTHREGVGFHFLDDDAHFVWASQRSGWKHFYLYGVDGKLVRRLTEGDFPVERFGGANMETREYLYTARSDQTRPYDIHVHRGSLDDTEFVVLSETTGQHDIQVAPSGDFYLDTHSTTARLPVTELRRADGSLVRLVAKSSLPPGTTFSPPEHFVAKAADGKTDIHGAIFKPVNFDPRKTYPVIENIYAGAFISYVPHRFDAGTPWYGDYLFEHGFVEVVIDGRGTPGRSKPFQDVVHGNLGRHEIADHAAALRQAARTRPWMDMSRVGIFGNSFGGYFTMRALLQAPDTYHAGFVAGLPVLNDNAVAPATECYLGIYDEESPAWRYASNLRLVGELDGHVRLVKGAMDVNTPLYGTMQMSEALLGAGKHFDMLILPDANHHYRAEKRSYRDYVKRDIVRYFDKRLR